jgi:hypothetical protein
MPTVEGRVTSPPLVVPGAVFHRSRREVLSTADGRDMATFAVDPGTECGGGGDDEMLAAERDGG